METLDIEREDENAPIKRARRSVSLEPSSSQSHRLFAPFRALGLVTNHVPFALQTRTFKGSSSGPQVHILTCLGNSWLLWEGGKMTLLFVGPDCLEPITCLAMDGDAIWASAGTSIRKYLRGKEVDRLINPLKKKVFSFIVFGEQILGLVDGGATMIIWNKSTKEVMGTIEFDHDFFASFILHPATYLNKILLTSVQGSMQLWNIRTKTCIHKFEAASLRDSVNPNTPCIITALVQSPAIDVVAIGFSTGEISLYDIRADERLMRLHMDGGSVLSLSFRSDGQSVLAAASSSGHISLWDLNNGAKLLHMIRGAHDRAVTAVEWIPGQPVLVSSGEDNAVKQWFFESPTSLPQLLKFRSGHQEPPHLIRYYGEDGKQLLTASRDRSLRYTSVVRDSRSFELSQGSLSKKATSLSIPVANLKFPPITQISTSSARSKDWDDVLTAHKQEIVARTWSVRDKKLGKWAFNVLDGKKKKAQASTIRAVCVTACGNFGLASSSSGVIEMWNMQSGIKRKTYRTGAPPLEVAARLRIGEKDRIVNGLATDSLNQLVIASTQDGTINFFDFHSQNLEHTLVLPAPCAQILLQRDSGLLAVTCDDLVLRIVDIETRRIVREMSSFGGNILDIAFSPDSRWLITTSMDSVIRTFDIPTGRLVDVFRTPSVATSLSFSPTSDFLATAHVNSVGVFLWANRAQYTEISLQGVSEDIIADVEMPTIDGSADDDALEALQSLSLQSPQDAFSTPTQLDGDLITLTLLPRSRWQTLLNLEVIQQRNKPKEPPKPPEKAPFFLPTLPGVEHRFAIVQNEKNVQSKTPNKRLEAGATQSESVFYKKLISEDHESSYEFFFSYTKTLTPAAIDLEIRSLVSLEGLSVFTNALTRRLRSHRDFEAVQTFMNVLMRIHGDVFIANPELREAIEGLRQAQKEESSRLLEIIASSLGTLSFVRDVL